MERKQRPWSTRGDQKRSKKKKEGDVFSMWSLPETLKVFAWLAWLF
jgi:hypothetical protein